MSDVGRDERITVRLSPGERARLDEFRSDESRSAYLRRLLRTAEPVEDPEAPSYGEAIRLLAESARDGSVTARVHLERALRGDRSEPIGPSELDRLLRED